MSAEVDIALPRIKDAEGYRKLPYKDTVGVSTIGYGCALDVGWSESFAAAVCKLQVEGAELECRYFDFWPTLDQMRRSVLIEMVFNLGIERFLGFRRFLTAVKAKNYAAAATEMLASLWAKQVGKRATRLAHIMETGTDA